MVSRTRRVRRLMLAACALVGGCGGGGGAGTGGTSAPSPTPSPTPTPTATINFTVSGLRPGQQLTLANGADHALVTANGTFGFATPVAVGTAYAITISAGPSVDSCTLANATGTVTAAVNVTVSCGPTTIHGFTVQDAGSQGLNTSVSPQIMVASDGNIYGTALGGGASGKGTIFRMTPGGDFAVLHDFTGNATDGSNPAGPLIEGPGGDLYGTTAAGGAAGWGTLFKITRSGVFTLLHSFDLTEGATPTGPLVQSGGHLYGHLVDVIFDYSISGSGVSVVHRIAFGENQAFRAPLALASNGDLLTVTTESDLSGIGGRLIRVTPSGTVSEIHNFTVQEGSDFRGNLLIDNDGNIYGVAAASQTPTTIAGNIFKISPSGVFTLLHQFVGSDGDFPEAGLTWGTDGNMYGTTTAGGAVSSYGTIFRITKDGVFTNLYTFDGGAAGIGPGSALVLGHSAVPLSDPLDIFYGATRAGGAHDQGAIFKY